MDDDLFDADAALSGIDAQLSADVTRRITKLDSKRSWESGVTLNLTTSAWRPSAVSKDRKSVLYVNAAGLVPRFVARRIVAARAAGLQPILALPMDALYRSEVLMALAEADALLFLIEDDNKPRSKALHFMSVIGDVGVPMSPEVRRSVAAKVWEEISSGKKHEKGRRLEALLSGLLSQVADLKVVETNYRTRTQEIDLVLQVDNFSNRVWQQSGVPLVLVEAKNRAQKTDQQSLNAFIAKLRTKRGRAKVGLLVSVSGFTEDARNEELRYSMSDTCVAMIDGAAVLRLIQSSDIDDELESIVRSAMLN